MNAQLLACPFCGGEPALVRMEDEDGEFAVVSCRSCGAASRQHYFLGDDAGDVVIDAWNARAALAAPKEAGKAAAYLCEWPPAADGLPVRGVFLTSPAYASINDACIVTPLYRLAAPSKEAGAAVETIKRIAAQLANDDCEGDAAELLEAMYALANPPGDQRQEGAQCLQCLDFISHCECHVQPSPPPEAAENPMDRRMASMIEHGMSAIDWSPNGDARDGAK